MVKVGLINFFERHTHSINPSFSTQRYKKSQTSTTVYTYNNYCHTYKNHDQFHETYYFCIAFSEKQQKNIYIKLINVIICQEEGYIIPDRLIEELSQKIKYEKREK